MTVTWILHYRDRDCDRDRDRDRDRDLDTIYTVTVTVGSALQMTCTVVHLSILEKQCLN